MRSMRENKLIKAIIAQMVYALSAQKLSVTDLNIWWQIMERMEKVEKKDIRKYKKENV